MRALILAAFSIVFISLPGNEATAWDRKSLPEAEKQLADQVDHWGLAFSDQLCRFEAGFAAQGEQLGDKGSTNFVVGVQHGLEKTPLNKYWFKGDYATTVSLSAAANEYENFQVAVLPGIGKELSSVTLTKSDLQTADKKHSIPQENIAIYRVVYAKTAPAGYPVLYTGPWPDLLLSNAPLAVKGTDLGLFWVEMKVPKDAVKGRYSGAFHINADGEDVALQVMVNVFDFSLPDRVPFPVIVTLRKPGGKEPMSAEDYRKLCAEMLRHGIDPVNMAQEFVSLTNEDFKAFDENFAFGLERGQQAFDIPSSVAKPEALGPLVKHLREKGWIDKTLVYTSADEPGAQTFKENNTPYYAKIHALYPDLRVYLASEYHPGIDKGCDVWLTDLSTGKGFDFARENAGKAELWVYYCHLPIHVAFQRPLVQAPNMEIDSEAIEHRLAFWIAWKYKTKGIYIWSGGPNADWKEPGWELSDKRDPFPFAGTHNGNGWLIYTGPNPSIRMKVLRDGLEDLGYLRLLAQLAERCQDPPRSEAILKLLSVPPEVLVTEHYFNRDPAALLKTREAIAAQIEFLQGQPAK